MNDTRYSEVLSNITDLLAQASMAIGEAASAAMTMHEIERARCSVDPDRVTDNLNDFGALLQHIQSLNVVGALSVAAEVEETIQRIVYAEA